MTSKEIINDLGLLPHPEGGYYKETYRSEETTINKNGDLRNVCTAIYSAVARVSRVTSILKASGCFKTSII